MSDTEERYRAILDREPDNSDALYRLGLIRGEQGRRQDAYDLLQRAARLANPSANLLSALGRAAALLGHDEEAQHCWTSALQANPQEAAALAGLGALFYKQSKLDLALSYLDQALALAPERVDVRSNLAGVQLRRGAFGVAELHLREALARMPEMANLHNSLAIVLLAQERLGEAESSLRAALALAPSHVEAQCNLGIVLWKGGHRDDAMAAFQAALALQPDHAGALAGLATVYQTLNRLAEARAGFARVIARDPYNWWVRWGLLMALPVLYGTQAEIAAARRGFAADLEALERDLPSRLVTDLGMMVTSIAARTNFYLHYQGENDRDLQQRYGAVVSRIAAAVFPQFARPLMPRLLAPGDKIRVGFCSAFFRNHSIAKTHGAWITGLPRERFEVVLFHLGAMSDDTTDRLKHDCRYVDCARLSQAELVATIAEAELDVLIWPDLGMEARAQIPAALRLAPVQVNGGGHPITSGLATMDYFLSSDLMEPAGGEAHYTERLIRLPHLAMAYPRPPSDRGVVPALVRTLKQAGQPLYLCSQSLYKLLPEDDEVFAAIAQAVPQAALLFISHSEPAITEFFRLRLAGAFARAGVDGQRVHFVPPLNQQDFYALNREIDVLLDSFAWSGCNSTLEALAFNRPVVTLPGTMMRARHTAGILTRLELPELIARNRADYVAIAARLGSDARWRAEITAKIAARSVRIYDDPAPLLALADWLEGVVRRPA